MKNIAVVCNYKLNSSRIGGMDRFFIAYDKVCKDMGHQITWFFSGGEMFEFYNKLDLHICSENLEVGFLDFQGKEKYDVVITHFLELCTPFFKSIKSIGDPKIIAVDHNPRPLGGFPLKKRLKNKVKGRLYSRYIDQFIGVSQYTVDSILNDYGRFLKKKTLVVYNGIATDVYLKRKEANTGKFIVASHLRPSKGIQDLILAVSQIPERFKKNLLIDIYGEGPMKEELAQLVKEQELENIIFFKNSVSNLHELYKEYSYMIQPTYMECFSLSILESLASNVPVITTPVGGNEEIIENNVNGYIFPAKDVNALEHILTEILVNKRGIESNISLKIEKDFTLQRMVEDHIKILECI